MYLIVTNKNHFIAKYLSAYPYFAAPNTPRNLKFPYFYLQKPFLSEKSVDIPLFCRTKRTSEHKVTLKLNRPFYYDSLIEPNVLSPTRSPIRRKPPALQQSIVEPSVLPHIYRSSSHQSMVEPPVLRPAQSPIHNKPPILRQIRCRTVGSTTYHESIIQHPVLPPAPSPIHGRPARTASNSGRTIGTTTHSAHHFSAKNNSEALPPINPW